MLRVLYVARMNILVKPPDPVLPALKGPLLLLVPAPVYVLRATSRVVLAIAWIAPFVQLKPIRPMPAPQVVRLVRLERLPVAPARRNVTLASKVRTPRIRAHKLYAKHAHRDAPHPGRVLLKSQTA